MGSNSILALPINQYRIVRWDSCIQNRFAPGPHGTGHSAESPYG